MPSQPSHATIVSSLAMENEEEITSKKIKIHLKKMRVVEKELSQAIDAFFSKRSFITEAASFWGKIPIWGKIIIGVSLVAVFLAFGIGFQSPILIVASGLVGFTYLMASAALDEHSLTLNHSKESLKTGILSLARTLNAIIEALNEVFIKLDNEVERFKRENDLLQENIKKLSTEVLNLESKIQDLSHTSEKLEATQIELRKISESIEKTKMDLEKKNAELLLEVDKLKLLNSLLTESSNQYLLIAAQNSDQQVVIMEKFHNLLDLAKDNSVEAITSLKGTSHQLIQVDKQLQEKNEEYEKLLNRHEKMTEYLNNVTQYFNECLKTIERIMNRHDLQSDQAIGEIKKFFQTAQTPNSFKTNAESAESDFALVQ